MLVFIDESGDTGLEIKKGATKYFTIALVAFNDHEEADACDRRIDLLRHEMRLKRDFEFHFYHTSDRLREKFFEAVLPYGFFYYGIVIDKEKLYGEGFKNKESFYKYACSLLFENAKEKLDSAIVVIDRSGRELFKYQLSKYLKSKINKNCQTKIKKVKMQESHRNNLLQLVDMIVGALNRSLNIQKIGYDSYRNMIKSREIYVQTWPK